MSERTVLLLGGLAAPDHPAADVVRRMGATPVAASDWKKARASLRSPDALCAIFPADMDDFEELCLEVRSELSGQDLPLIAVVPTAWDSRLARLFMFAIDDYVAADNLESLTPKLLALGRGNPWTNLRPESGSVIIADPDRSHRVLYGRMLRRKGLGVEFAVDGEEVVRMISANENIRAVLASATLPPDGAVAAIEACLGAGGDAAAMPWIVGGTSEQLEAIHSAAPRAAAMRLFSTEDPPESVLFLVNELLAPPPANVRRSPRLLYGGPGTFRVVGSRHLVPAFTYNINRTGLFIRTLVPPPRESELVMEFRPPHGEGRARVYGTVVWRKECSQQGGPMVPAGMGVIYTKLPVADGAALNAGYEELLGGASGQRTTDQDEVAREPDA